MTEYDEWVGENPLRMWRKANKLSMMKVAVLLGTGLSTIQTWERGVNRPNYDNLEKIGKAIGLGDVIQAKEAWDEWYSKRPTAQN